MSVVPERAVRIQAGAIAMSGELCIPAGAHALVVFADGRPNSRFDSHERHVARLLNKHHLATLLLDLLIPEEQENDFLGLPPRLNLGVLVERLVAANDWLGAQADTKFLRLGYLGVVSGAGAALAAAALRARSVGAAVCVSGRFTPAADALADVLAPTLLIVGADDPALAKNKAAFALLACEKELVVVPGAGSLLAAPKAADQVATLARDWFLRYLVARGESVLSSPG